MTIADLKEELNEIKKDIEELENKRYSLKQHTLFLQDKIEYERLIGKRALVNSLISAERAAEEYNIN